MIKHIAGSNIFLKNVIKRVSKIQLSDECCKNDELGELVMCFFKYCKEKFASSILNYTLQPQ